MKLSCLQNCVLSIMFCMILIGFLIHTSFHVQAQTFTNICSTPGCKKAAESIIKNMNTSHKPCNNFYLFACGNFVKGADVPRGQGYTDSISRMTYKVQKKLKSGLEKKLKKAYKLRPFKLLQSYYESCSNSDLTGKIYQQKILDIVKNEFGSWPILVGESWNESEFDWRVFIYKSRQLGLTNSMSSLIHFELGKSREIENRSYIRLDEAITGIDRNQLKSGLKIQVVKDYYSRMVNAAIFFGADEIQAKVELNKSLEFEIELAKLQQGKHQFYSMQDLIASDSKFPWHEYLNKFLPLNTSTLSATNISVDLKYLESLLKLIQNKGKRIVANYLVWRVIMELMDFVKYHITDAKNSFVTRGATGNELWQNCINYLRENMPLATGAFYIKKYFNKNYKTDVLEITNNLHKTFKNVLSEVTWMNNETKTIALKKLESMNVYAGYPDELLDDHKLDTYFKNLPDLTDNFLKNHLSLSLFNYEKKLEYFTKYSNKSNWFIHGSSATVDVIYHHEYNSIDIYAGFLQETFFSPDKPNYLNYGGIGHVIAHEMSRGFDQNGSQFDDKGNEINWWDPQTASAYENRKQCFIKQYNKFKVSKRKIPLNGEYTLENNIADNVGFQLAYRAYEEWENEHGQELGLPELHYTPRQLFWISAANTACTRFRRKGWDIILKDKRSPAPFRIIGAFSNMREFARDFGCPVNSRMNSKNKCSVW